MPMETIYLGTYRTVDVAGGLKIIPLAVCCDARHVIARNLAAAAEKGDLDEIGNRTVDALTAFCVGLSGEKARQLVDTEEINIGNIQQFLVAAMSADYNGQILPREDALELHVKPLGFGKRSKRLVELADVLKADVEELDAGLVVEFISLAAGIQQEIVRPYVERGYASIDTMSQIAARLSEPARTNEDTKKN